MGVLHPSLLCILMYMIVQPCISESMYNQEADDILDFEFMKLDAPQERPSGRGPQHDVGESNGEPLPHSVMYYGHAFTTPPSVPNTPAYSVTHNPTNASEENSVISKPEADMKSHLNDLSLGTTESLLFAKTEQSSKNFQLPTTYRPSNLFVKNNYRDTKNDESNDKAFGKISFPKKMGFYVRKDVMKKFRGGMKAKRLRERMRQRIRDIAMKTKAESGPLIDQSTQISQHFKEGTFDTALNSNNDSTVSIHSINDEPYFSDDKDLQPVTIKPVGEDYERKIRQIANHQFKDEPNSKKKFGVKRFASKTHKSTSNDEHVSHNQLNDPKVYEEIKDAQEDMLKKMIRYMKSGKGFENSNPSFESGDIESTSPSSLLAISTPLTLNRNYFQETLNNYLSQDLKVRKNVPLHSMHGPPYDHYHNGYVFPPPHIVLQEPYFHTISQTSITNPPLQAATFVSHAPIKAVTTPIPTTMPPTIYRSTTYPMKKKITYYKSQYQTATERYLAEPFFEPYDPLPQKYTQSNIKSDEGLNDSLSRKKGKSLKPKSINSKKPEKLQLSKSHFKSEVKSGKEFPTYSGIPFTSFDCERHGAGIYADSEAQCQVWHVCEVDGRQHSFLCPNSTIFNQQLLTCDWWYNVDCNQAESYYRTGPNSEIFKSSKIKQKDEEKLAKSVELATNTIDDGVSHRILKQKTFTKHSNAVNSFEQHQTFHVTPSPFGTPKPQGFVEFYPYHGSEYPMFKLRPRRSHGSFKKRSPMHHKLKPSEVENNQF